MTRIPGESIPVIYSFRCFFFIGLIMVSALFRVWQKDELSAVQREIVSINIELKQLYEERKKLRADIAIEKSSGRIQKKSLSIGLIPAHSRQLASTWNK
ncbi:MAG: hypothetical protein VX294_14790 [Candidatus Latescibacterota bacterium]|nr:hypothetical protein [Candidatus Latescibacterota bacterium]